jgi:3-phosphoshikimate 1-carboxyvinyltransferase
VIEPTRPATTPSACCGLRREVEVEDGGTRRGSSACRRPAPERAPVRVPGDPSSAAFPLVAALITPGSEVTVEGVLLNPLRTGLFETLREMGADRPSRTCARMAARAVGDVTARYSRLRASVVPPARAPSMIDEYPILAWPPPSPRARP